MYILELVLDNIWLSIFMFLWFGLSIAVLATDAKLDNLGFKTIAKMLFIPLMLMYEFTISLFVMPLLYGRYKLGIFGYVPTWLFYALLAVLFSWWHETIGEHINKLNRLANYFMGFTDGSTVSTELGKRIDRGEASSVTCLHCRILAIYDRRGYHCSEKATKLF